MGIYIVEKGILKFIPKDEYYDLPELIMLLIKNEIKALSYPFKNYWRDIGRKDNYELALEEYANFKIDSLFLID